MLIYTNFDYLLFIGLPILNTLVNVLRSSYNNNDSQL